MLAMKRTLIFAVRVVVHDVPPQFSFMLDVVFTAREQCERRCQRQQGDQGQDKFVAHKYLVV